MDLTQSKLTGSWISSSRHPIPFEGCDSSTCPSTSYATSEYPVPSTIAQNTQTDLSYLQSHPHAQWTTTYSSTTNNPSLVYSDAATVHSVTHSKQPSNIGSVGNSRPVPPLTSTNSTTTPTCTAASSGANNWTLIQQALDIHSQKGDYMHRQRPSQIKGDLRFAGRNTPVSSNSVFNHPTPPLLSGPRPYISYMAPPNVTIPPNASYMINGTPGTPAMRLTLIPEDFQKHSSKERERR